MDVNELVLGIATELIRKSGVREWEDAAAQQAIGQATIGILESLGYVGYDMALPDYIKVGPGTPKTIRNSGGDAAITLASLANGNGTSTGARQAATLDFGALWAQLWRIVAEFELAATPTAGNVITLHGSWYGSTGAGLGNTSGSDAAYTGYSNNIDNALRHLEFLGAFVCTAQATTTVQKMIVATIFPKARYLNLVVNNKSGAAFHNTDTNQVIRLTPLEFSLED